MRYSQGRRRRCGPGSSPGRTSGTAPWVLYVHDVVRELFEAEVLLMQRRTPLAAETSILRDRGLLSVPRASPAACEEIIA